MKIFFLLLMLGLSVLPLHAAGSKAYALKNGVHVERFRVLHSRGLDPLVVTKIGASLGEGSFWMRALEVSSYRKLVAPPRVLFFYRNLSDLENQRYFRRYICVPPLLVSEEMGDDANLLKAYFKFAVLPPSQIGVEDMAFAVNVVLFEGRAVSLKPDWLNLSDEKLDLVRYTSLRKSDFRDVLRGVVGADVINRSKVGWNWTGFFIHNNGSVEKVGVFIGEASGEFRVERFVSRPVGFFPTLSTSGGPAEEWLVESR